MQKLKIFLSLLLVSSMFAMYVPQVHASGTWTQSDWSGGGGQTNWSATNQYNSQGGDGLYDTSANQLSMKINAQTVVGQSNFTTGTSQNTTVSGVSAYGLYYPFHAITVGSKFIVSDKANNRVLIYNSIPATYATPADVVIGQADMTHNSANQGGSVAANTLNGPIGLASDGNNLLIGDTSNNRVLIYNTIPTTNDVSADVVIGQADMVHGDANQGSTVGDNTLSGFPGAISLSLVGSKLIIGDGFNNRVLIYNSIPTSNDASADVVIGQADMTHNSANQGGSVAANTLNRPEDVYSDGTKLFVTDDFNNRVLIYNTIPTTDNASADLVVGQPDMVSNTPNNGGLGANTLQNPVSTFYSGSKLFVNDSSNSRILVFNSLPVSNGASADVVIGQLDMTHNTPNYGGITASSLQYPFGVMLSGSTLYILDGVNNRILGFNTVPTSNGASADFVFGQPDMTHNTANNTFTISSANSLYLPASSIVVNNKLIVADTYNNRVLIYNSFPASDNVSADVVIGQPDMMHVSANQGGTVAANTLNYPSGVSSDGTKLFIADVSNNRVLIYNTIPTTNNASANVVIGQADMTHNSANQGATVAANTLVKPSNVFSDGGRLYIDDSWNNRVLIYNTIPTTNNASADVVVGQPDMTHSLSNNGGIGANTLYTGGAGGSGWVYVAGGKLFIADRMNNRVLIFNSIPTTNNASADVVVGQPDMTHNLGNNGGIGANTLYRPASIYSNGTKLFVADSQNNRILIWNNIPNSNGASADIVIGQADFTHNSFNQSSAVAANTLYNPFNLSFGGAAYNISDSSNNRLLIYSGPHSSTLTSSTFTSTTGDTTWGPLSYDATIPTNTSISFEYSGNGGTTWQTITDPANQSLGTSKTMTYRVTLSNTDGISTPILRSVSIAYTTATGGGGLAGGLPTANPSASSGQATTATTTSGNTTNNPLANNTPANSSTTLQACQPGDKYNIETGALCSTPSLSITTSSNSCTITQTLKQGSKGEDVKCLQRDLTITQDGLFGPKTKQSVISFQKNHNLTPDGVVGPKTRAVLNQ